MLTRSPSTAKRRRTPPTRPRHARPGVETQADSEARLPCGARRLVIPTRNLPSRPHPLSPSQHTYSEPPEGCRAARLPRHPNRRMRHADFAIDIGPAQAIVAELSVLGLDG